MKLLVQILGFLVVAPLASATGLFPERSTVADKVFEKQGEKRFVYKRFFKVYDAALYVEPKTPRAAILSGDYGIKLQFNYLRDIDRDLAIKHAGEALERNLNAAELASIAGRVDQINRVYRSVEEGDSARLVYDPEIGTTYYFNNEKLITIPGKDFASLYFQVWLGENPISTRMRDALLGEG